MADESPIDPFGPLAAQWLQSATAGVGENWSSSILLFLVKRAAENGAGFIAGNDLAESSGWRVLPGGHVGLFVSSKSQGTLSKGISEWLVARD